MKKEDAQHQNAVSDLRIEQRIHGGIRDAFKAMREQHLPWDRALQYLLRACDRADLEDNSYLARVQAALLGSPNLRAATHIGTKDLAAVNATPGNRLAIGLLKELVRVYLQARGFGACGLTCGEDFREFKRGPKADVKTAIRLLANAGLVRLQPMPESLFAPPPRRCRPFRKRRPQGRTHNR